MVSGTRASFCTTGGHVSRRGVRLIAPGSNDAYLVGR